MTNGIKEWEPGKQPKTLVALKYNKLGHEINQRGKSFPLSKIFSEVAKSYQPAGDCVYFRTELDNIYRLDFYYGVGRMINANESRIRRRINPIELSPEILKQQKLTIGKRFAYGNEGRRTTRIVEIVTATNTIYKPDDLRIMTNGRSSAIVDDFEGRLPKPSPFPKS
jgi:hypothetical protein